jgi:hypothetical protein
LPEVALGEPTAEPYCQIPSQPLYQLFSIGSAPGTGLFVLDDPLSHHPVRGGHYGVDRPEGAESRLLDQPYKGTQQCTVRFVRRVRFATFDSARLLFH